MDTDSHNPMEVDVKDLILRYAHTRIARPKARSMMMNSIARFGQIRPVVTVSEEQRLVLIDGYLRADALKGLGRDTIIAEVRQNEQQALYHLLSQSHERQWEAVEQAWIIRDVHVRFETSLSEIARNIGRDLSWVSRRVSLIDTLADPILKVICAGHVSSWIATRVLVPLARANPLHAQKLSDHLSHQSMSARDLSTFFEHYQRSNKQIREQMVDDPCLFVRVYKARAENNGGKDTEQGPEEQWLKDFNIVLGVLKRQIKRLPQVIYPGQDQEDRDRLMRAFNDAWSIMQKIEEKLTKGDTP